MTNRIARKPGEFSLGLVHDFVVSFGKRGGSPDLLQRMTEDTAAMSRLVEYLAIGCPKIDQSGVIDACLPKGAALARLVLGDDFISPGEIEKLFGFSYDYQQFTHLTNTVPDLEKLLWLKANQYMLVAGPVTDTNLLGVCDFDPVLLNDDRDWIQKAENTFSRTDRVRGGVWLMLRKSVVPDSFSKDRWGQQALVIFPERVPNVAEVAYGMALYGKVRGIQLLLNRRVRTSSVTEAGSVCIGCRLDVPHLSVRVHWDDDCHDYLGIASAL